jgi:hypothetical protein
MLLPIQAAFVSSWRAVAVPSWPVELRTIITRTIESWTVFAGTIEPGTLTKWAIITRTGKPGPLLATVVISRLVITGLIGTRPVELRLVETSRTIAGRARTVIALLPRFQIAAVPVATAELLVRTAISPWRAVAMGPATRRPIAVFAKALAARRVWLFVAEFLLAETPRGPAFAAFTAALAAEITFTVTTARRAVVAKAARALAVPAVVTAWTIVPLEAGWTRLIVAVATRRAPLTVTACEPVVTVIAFAEPTLGEFLVRPPGCTRPAAAAGRPVAPAAARGSIVFIVIAGHETLTSDTVEPFRF